MPTDWKFADLTQSIVVRTLDDGAIESCIATRDDVLAWVAAGNTIGAYSEPTDALKARIDTQRDVILAAGFADTGDGGTGKTWQLDPDAKTNLLTVLANCNSLLTLGQGSAEIDVWAADNAIFQMTTTAFVEMVATRIFPWGSSVMAYARTLKNDVDNGTPPADITAGWP